jgi:acetyltransferase-like isoleucine patch superfamily enzyme
MCYITKNTRIGDDVFIGPCLSMANEKRISSHGREIPQILSAPHIMSRCRIGSGVKLQPGVIIGQNALVGQASLVMRDIPSGEIWYGHPAVFKGKVPNEELI